MAFPLGTFTQTNSRLGLALPQSLDGVPTLPSSLITPLPPTKLSGSFPAFCPSKRILLGAKIFPFSGLDYTGDFELSHIRWRVKRDAEAFGNVQEVLIGTFTDLLAAARFTPQTVVEFGTYHYEICLVSALSEVTVLELDVVCQVIAGASKSVQRQLTFRPFADFMLAADTEQIKRIEYAVLGDMVVARTEINRQVLLSGRHEIDRNASHLYDGHRDFNLLGIRIGSDILRNVSDGSSGVITGISDDGHRLNVVLSGGFDNDFDVRNEYEILEGLPLDLVARSFELVFTSRDTAVVQLFVTDMSDNVSVASVTVRSD